MNAELNWEALRIVLRGDVQIYGRLAAGADHSAAGNAQRERYGAMGEQALKTLDSMATIEAADTSPSVPGLAEHTAAAQDKIIEASQPVSHLRRDCTCSHEPGWPCDETCPAHSAAACDTITKAAQ